MAFTDLLKRILGRPLSVLGLTVLLLLCMFLAFHFASRRAGTEAYVTQYLRGQNPAELLGACRMLISAKQGNTIVGAVSPTDAEGISVAGDSIASTAWMPRSFVALHPRYICIRSDYVLVALDTPGERTVLLGFRKGAHQFGTRQLIDGLWYWNGKYADPTHTQARHSE